MTVKLRYKAPDADESSLIEYAVHDDVKPIASASPETRFAASVAEVGLLLRDSPNKGGASFDQALELALESQGADPAGHRREFVSLARTAKALSAPRVTRPVDKP
jgi:Ca-activated chloride channel family protein